MNRMKIRLKTRKSLLLFIGVLCCFIEASGQKTALTIKETVKKFEEAVVAKDISLLQGIIADNFAVSTTTWPASGNLLKTIFNNKNFEYIRIDSDAFLPVDKDYKKVSAVIKEIGKEQAETGIVLDKENRIVYVDYFDWLFGRNRYQESRLQAKIPITVTETGSIILSVRINNHPEEFRFLFDSGADGMAISRELADSIGLTVSGNQQTSVVGGNMSVSISSGNTVHLDTLKLTNQNIAIFDRIRQGIDGLIGLNILKMYVAEFNLDKNSLSLYNFGTYSYGKEGEVIDITVPVSVPVIPGSINLTGDKYVDGRFAFDTGANYYFIGFSSFVRSNKMLVSGFVPESQTSTVSFGKATPTFNGKCKDFKIDQLNLKDMPVSLQAGENWDSKTDGSLGVRFISRYNFTINLLDKKIHLIENKRSKLPVE